MGAVPVREASVVKAGVVGWASGWFAESSLCGSRTSRTFGRMPSGRHTGGPGQLRRADALRDLGAEVVVADMPDIVAVRAAMRGCSVVYFTMSVSPNYLEAAASVAVTAKSLGVKAFVNLAQMTLSQMSETGTTSSPQQQQEWLAQQMLRWSGLPVVYLRPTAFFEMLLLQAAKSIRDDNAIRFPFADGKNSPIAAATWGLPPLRWPTRSPISARSTT
jgi:NAD(P)H-binding